MAMRMRCTSFSPTGIITQAIMKLGAMLGGRFYTPFVPIRNLLLQEERATAR